MAGVHGVKNWGNELQTSRRRSRGSMSRSVLFDRANDEWEAGNVRKAFELFSQAATAGDPFAQTSLGYFYDEGIGVKKNAEKAIWWYRKAARKGSVAAINNLAITYRDSGNLRRARSWFKKAFSKGDGDAALELAKLSLAGRRQDAKSAKKYLEAAVGSKYILSDSKKEAAKLLNELNRRL
jgi:TPR repeat protein